MEEEGEAKLGEEGVQARRISTDLRAEGSHSLSKPCPFLSLMSEGVCGKGHEGGALGLEGRPRQMKGAQGCPVRLPPEACGPSKKVSPAELREGGKRWVWDQGPPLAAPAPMPPNNT